MKNVVTFIHLGRGENEVGVQFDMLDDADQKTSMQRAFLADDDAPQEALAAVWAWVQTKLDAQLDQLPLEFPPEMVTTALMQKRNAQAAAKVANDQRSEAEQKRDAAEAAENAAKARLVDLERQIAEKEARAESAKASP